MQEAERSLIEGTVESVIYQNQENGYTVLRLDGGEGQTLTVVGCMPGVAPGEGIAVEGTWTRHASYGEQFKAEAVERRTPAGTKAIFDYLSSGAVKGIGAATARRMVEEFGEETLTVLEEHPERLTQIKGVTRKKALAMGENFRLQMGMRRLLEFLGEHEVPLQLAMPLYRKYGDRALEIIRGNPYLLVDGELGVEFSTADKLALSMGMEGDDPQRIEAGLLFELAHNLDNGHTFLPRRKLLPATAQLIELEGEPEALEDALEALLERGEVIQETVANEEAVYLHDLCEAEQYVAFRLAEMARGEQVPPHGLDGLIDRIQAEQGIVYAPQQRQAVELAAASQVMLLTGGPGTGKTTSLRGVLALFEQLGLETALAAPTGRAAKRLGELCGMEAATIHRLLETQYDPHSGRLVFAHDEDEPLKADAVIVDETSMVDILLMRGLLSALRPECRLILVGDPDQLPSVGPGNILGEILQAGVLPTVRLTEIFRQARQSLIVRNAHRIVRGEMPCQGGKTDDFFMMEARGEACQKLVCDLVTDRLPHAYGLDPMRDIQVLCPGKRNLNGSEELNARLQQLLNPPSPKKPEIVRGRRVLRLGDKVMQVKNDYDIPYESLHGESGTAAYNGDMGVIVEVDPGGRTVKVQIDDRVYTYTADQLEELEPAYAITIHKSQGSEFPAVVIPLADVYEKLQYRNLLYTGVTRARQICVLPGRGAILGNMVRRAGSNRRYSCLRHLLARAAGQA